MKSLETTTVQGQFESWELGRRVQVIVLITRVVKVIGDPCRINRALRRSLQTMKQEPAPRYPGKHSNNSISI